MICPERRSVYPADTLHQLYVLCPAMAGTANKAALIGATAPIVQEFLGVYEYRSGASEITRSPNWTYNRFAGQPSHYTFLAPKVGGWHHQDIDDGIGWSRDQLLRDGFVLLYPGIPYQPSARKPVAAQYRIMLQSGIFVVSLIWFKEKLELM